MRGVWLGADHGAGSPDNTPLGSGASTGRGIGRVVNGAIATHPLPVEERPGDNALTAALFE